PTNVSSIVLSFSLPIDLSSLPANLIMTADGVVVVGAVSNSPDNQSITFTMSQGLQSGTTYISDLSGLKDICGDLLAGSTTYTFTTAAAQSAVTTLPATSVTGLVATLNGSINPTGTPGCAAFETGSTPNLNNPSSGIAVGSVAPTFVAQPFSYNF